MPSESKPSEPGKKSASRKKLFAPIRWTLAQAASELRINPRTIAKRAKEAGVLPGKDKRFGVLEIANCVYGDYERERTRKMTEDADAAALSNARERKNLVDKDDLKARMEPIYVGMKETILNSSMSETEKDATLSKLAALHLV